VTPPQGPEPYTGVRAALLGPSDTEAPSVAVPLVDEAGGRIDGSRFSELHGPEDSAYDAEFDEKSGTVVFRLKDPSQGVQAAEEYTVILDDDSRFTVQVGSSAGELNDVNWTGANGAFVDNPSGITFAGDTNLHLTGADVGTPAGYEGNEAPDGSDNRALHVQWTDSSLTAESGDASSSVDMTLGRDGGHGSFSISNDGGKTGEVRHDVSVHAWKPIGDEREWTSEEFPKLFEKTEYDASLSATVSATNNADAFDQTAFWDAVLAEAQTRESALYGRIQESAEYMQTWYPQWDSSGKYDGWNSQDWLRYAAREYRDYDAGNAWRNIVNEVAADYAVENTIHIAEGDLHIGNSAETYELSADKAAIVSGTYAGKGGQVDLEADDISVTASGAGLAETEAAATVSGVRSDGALLVSADYSAWEGLNSSTTITAGENVDIRAQIDGNTNTQSHAGITYAGVAATEDGQVAVQAGGDVNIAVDDVSDGTAALSVTGGYGIFSGYGFGARDRVTWEDFFNENGDRGALQDARYQYSEYNESLWMQYAQGKYGVDYYDPDEAQDRNQQSKVSVEADGNVNIDVSLERNFSGEAAAVKVAYGDVDIQAGGDINASVHAAGTHLGDASVSVLHHSNIGNLSLRAEGDVNLNLEAGGGTDLSVVHFENYGKNYSSEQEVDSRTVILQGENVSLRGHVGNGAVEENSIAGISFESSFKGYKKGGNFIAKADDVFSVEVEALGGWYNAAADGILAQNSGYTEIPVHVGIDAEHAVISAKAEGYGSSVKASAVSVKGSSLLIDGEGALDQESLYEAVEEFDRYQGDEGQRKGVSDLTLKAESTGLSMGIEVKTSDVPVDGEYYEEDRTALYLKADTLKVQAGSDSGYEARGISVSSGMGGEHSETWTDVKGHYENGWHWVSDEIEYQHTSTEVEPGESSAYILAQNTEIEAKANAWGSRAVGIDVHSEGGRAELFTAYEGDKTPESLTVTASGGRDAVGIAASSAAGVRRGSEVRDYEDGSYEESSGSEMVEGETHVTIGSKTLNVTAENAGNRAVGISGSSTGGQTELTIGFEGEQTIEDLIIRADGHWDAVGITAESSTGSVVTSEYTYSRDADGHETELREESTYKSGSSASVVVRADSLNIEATSEGYGATGIAGRSDGGESELEVTAGELTINATGTYRAEGITAVTRLDSKVYSESRYSREGAGSETELREWTETFDSHASVVVNADTLNIVATSSQQSAAGIYSSNGSGGIDLEVTADELSITASGAGSTSGITAYGGINLYTQVDRTSSSDSGGNTTLSEETYTSDSQGSNTHVRVTADSLHTEVTSGGNGPAKGIEVFADSGSYVEVSIEAREMDFTVTGGENVFGIDATSMDRTWPTASTSVEKVNGEVISESNTAGTQDYRSHAQIEVKTDSLNLAVAGTAGHVAGLYAAGADGRLEVSSLNNTDMRVTIACTITESGLNGIALEAVRGGYVSIVSGDGNDAVTLGGDIVAQHGGGTITVDTGDGNDTVSLQGKIVAASNAEVSILSGGGNDVVTLNGGILASGGGKVTVDAGDGNNTVSVDGDIVANNWATDGVSIRSGGGNDVITLNGNITTEWGGKVTVDAGDGNNTVSLNGDIAVKSTYAEVSIQSGGGNDSITLHGDIAVESSYAEVSILSGAGNDTVTLNGDIAATMGGKVKVDAGAGDDTVSLNGEINVDASSTFSLSGGQGHDLLILKAPDAETFEQWYKPWFESAEIKGMGFEEVKVEGVGVDLDNFPWLTDLFADQGIPVTLQDANSTVYVTPGNYLQGMVDSFDFDHSDDTLFVKFDQGYSLNALTRNIGDFDKLQGLENLVLDVTDSTNPNSALNGLDTLLTSLDSLGGDEPKLFLRATDETKADAVSSAIEEAGWSASAGTATLNGVQYQLYTNDGSEEQLYVALITNGTL
jgi:hypothetical protein